MQECDFSCKQFSISHKSSALKVGTDAFILGCIANSHKPLSILDIGTGTGILSLMLAQKYSEAMITAIDIDSGAIKDAKINFANSKWHQNLAAIQIDFQNFSTHHTFDLIVSNPPFFQQSKLSQNHSKNYARHNISLTTDLLYKHSAKLMHKSSMLYIIVPFEQKTKHISKGLQYNLFVVQEIIVKPKENTEPNRIVLAFSKTSSSIKKEELCIRKENGEYTSQYRELTQEYYLNF